jgi:hypothetical protein
MESYQFPLPAGDDNHDHGNEHEEGDGQYSEKV